MRSVASVVEHIVMKQPFIVEGLSRGIINNAALAEEIIPEIEDELGKKVKFSAVNMAIRRLGERIGESHISELKFDKNSEVSLRSDLVEITFYRTEKVQEVLQKLYGVVDMKRGDFLTITQGLYEITVVINKRVEERAKRIIRKLSVKKIIRDLSSITVNIPKHSIDTIGMFYMITRELTWNNINIVEVVSTYTELTVIVGEKDTSAAYEIVKGLVRRCQ